MRHLQLTIPAQDSKRASIKIKPREVRSWLDNLPYLDLQRSARLAHEQLRLMNRQPMPTGTRLEILGYFLGAYQRLAEQGEGRYDPRGCPGVQGEGRYDPRGCPGVQGEGRYDPRGYPGVQGEGRYEVRVAMAREGALGCDPGGRPAASPGNPTQDSHNLQTLVKRLCQDIGFGYKIVAHDLVNNKNSGFMETRNLPLALLGAIHTLGLQLADCYASYRSAPRSLWSECLALYAYAWESGREKYSAPLPGFGEQQIDTCFRLIALLRLADPYRLPNGMAAAFHDYFSQHQDLCRIHSEPPADKNHFQLREAFQQAPEDQDPHLYLEIEQLLVRMDIDIKKLAQVRQAKAIGLPAEIPASSLLRSLRQMRDHWRNHPTRRTEREEVHTRIDLVGGLDAVYCMINHGRCFDPSLFLKPEEEHSIDLGSHPAPDHDTVQNQPTPFACTSINRSSGGLAVRYRGPQVPHPHVGQLVALHRPSAQSNAGWVVAVCRRLVESEDGPGFELGLQYLVREPRPVVIRVMNKVRPQGRQGEPARRPPGGEGTLGYERGPAGEYQAAIAATQKRGQQRVHTLIARSGEILTGSRVVIYEQGNQQSVHCSEQLESGPGFERFIFLPV